MTTHDPTHHPHLRRSLDSLRARLAESGVQAEPIRALAVAVATSAFLSIHDEDTDDVHPDRLSRSPHAERRLLDGWARVPDLATRSPQGEDPALAGRRPIDDAAALQHLPEGRLQAVVDEVLARGSLPSLHLLSRLPTQAVAGVAARVFAGPPPPEHDVRSPLALFGVCARAALLARGDAQILLRWTLHHVAQHPHDELVDTGVAGQAELTALAPLIARLLGEQALPGAARAMAMAFDVVRAGGQGPA